VGKVVATNLNCLPGSQGSSKEKADFEAARTEEERAFRPRGWVLSVTLYDGYTGTGEKKPTVSFHITCYLVNLKRWERFQYLPSVGRMVSCSGAIIGMGPSPASGSGVPVPSLVLSVTDWFQLPRVLSEAQAPAPSEAQASAPSTPAKGNRFSSWGMASAGPSPASASRSSWWAGSSVSLPPLPPIPQPVFTPAQTLMTEAPANGVRTRSHLKGGRAPPDSSLLSPGFTTPTNTASASSRLSPDTISGELDLLDAALPITGNANSECRTLTLSAAY
jgi:hypothetical protein